MIESEALPSQSTRSEPASSSAKRTLDVVAAGVGLFVLSPLLLVIAALVFVSSPGSVTFRQQRVGLGGQHFTLFKFRSMVRDAERRLAENPELRRIYLSHDFKVPAHLDTRLTRVGRFLRRTSLDELPQLWNVLRGDMSLVGPRPVVPDELAKYGDKVALYESVRPGLTGPWQASGRSTVSYEERITLDTSYVRDWSFGRDISLLVKTVPAVLKRHGAH